MQLWNNCSQTHFRLVTVNPLFLDVVMNSTYKETSHGRDIYYNSYNTEPNCIRDKPVVRCERLVGICRIRPRQ